MKIKYCKDCEHVYCELDPMFGEWEVQNCRKNHIHPYTNGI